MAVMTRLGDVATITQGLNPAIFGGADRHGDWSVRLVRISDIQGDRLVLENLETIVIEQNVKSEKHLLQPDDVLVSARSTVFKAAVVPPSLTRAVADATLLVVRVKEPGLGHYLWWFLTSSSGRQQALTWMMGSSTLLFLPARNLAEVAVPVPERWELARIVDLIDASERAYVAATEAATVRREAIRDAIVDRLRLAAKHHEEREGEWH